MTVPVPRPTRRRVRTHPPRATRRAAAPETSSFEVLKNRPFLLLWLAQLFTQVGGNMVIYGLTVLISAAYNSTTLVSALLLCFLVPAILFSAIAGVLVDQVDKRMMLIVTNIMRGVAFLAIVLVGTNLPLMYLLVIFVATVTTFFGPAEASMIPTLVPKSLLLPANGLFTLTMNAAFAVGFALFGPFLVVLSGPQLLVFIVALCYFVAAAFCWTLPSVPPTAESGPVTAGRAVADAERAVGKMVDELREGIQFIRDHHEISWSLSYLGITGALIGVLGSLGPQFAKNALGLSEKDFVVVVLPLGLGIATGILALNAFGRYLPRRRVIETGMVVLGMLLAILSVVGPISKFLEGRASATGLQEVSRVVSLLSLVVGIAFLAGVAYAVVAISAQTQLQEDLPEDVRGRVFGVLNMLVSIASLLPIVIVGPIADAVGTPAVIFASACLIGFWGVASILSRGPLRPLESVAHAVLAVAGTVDPVSVATGPGEFAHAGSGHASAPATAGHARSGHGAAPSEPASGKAAHAAPAEAVPPAEVPVASEPSHEAPPPGPRTEHAADVAVAPPAAAESDDVASAADVSVPPDVAPPASSADGSSPDVPRAVAGDGHVPGPFGERSLWQNDTPVEAPPDAGEPPPPPAPPRRRLPFRRGDGSAALHRPRGVVRRPVVEGGDGFSLGLELRRLRRMFRRDDEEPE